MKQIKIAKPCHENWNDFTPTQKGAFCGKCQIDVIDFSNKTNTEIKNILDKKSGQHMCGRFSTTQLNNFNSDYSLWQNQSQSTFQSKFIFAVILGFGLTLFSCENSAELSNISNITTSIQTLTTNLPELTTEDSLINIDTTLNNTNYQQTPSIKECNITPPLPDIDIMGDITYIETTTGIVELIEEPIDFVKGEIAPIEEDTLLKEPIKISHPLIMGKFEIPNSQKDEIKVPTKQNCSKKTIKANCSPNPTTGKSKLTVDVTTKAFYSIKIFNEQGQFIETVCDKVLEKGEGIFRINLTNQTSGIYIIKIVNDMNSTSLKIIKTH